MRSTLKASNKEARLAASAPLFEPFRLVEFERPVTVGCAYGYSCTSPSGKAAKRIQRIRGRLRSGLHHVARAQALADVVGLIRCRGLTQQFAEQLPARHRSDFCTILESVSGLE